MTKRKAESLEDTVVKARERGLSWWDIKQQLGVPMKTSQEIVKRVAPIVYPSTLRVRKAWEVGTMLKRGCYEMEHIAKHLGISMTTAYAAKHIWEWTQFEAGRAKTCC